MKKIEIEQKALDLRQKIGLSSTFHEDILRDKLEEIGFFLFYHPFGNEGISGAVYYNDLIKVIIVNSSHSLGRQNFTLAHELGHMELHKGFNVIDIEDGTSGKEREADEFATYFLMPRDVILSIKSLPNDSVWTSFDVMTLSQKFRVSYLSAYNRARDVFGKRLVPEKLKNVSVLKVAKNFGFSERLYRSTNEEYLSERMYVEKALKAYKNHKISMGKFLSFMNDVGLNGYEILDSTRNEE